MNCTSNHVCFLYWIATDIYELLKIVGRGIAFCFMLTSSLAVFGSTLYLSRAGSSCACVVEGKRSLYTQKPGKVEHAGLSLQREDMFTCPPGMLGKHVVYNLVTLCCL